MITRPLRSFSLLLLTLFIYLPGGVAQSCEYPSVSFKADFSGGHLSRCKQLGERHYELVFLPENRPVNSSPWYAFEVAARSPQTLKLILTFDGDAPRYLPKISRDKQHWHQIAFQADSLGFHIELKTDNKPLWIAGQEILDNDYYDKWLSGVKVKNVALIELGKSTQGRSVKALESKYQNNTEWLLIIGRQHPPEITGALAMHPFVDNILGDSDLAKTFRQRFNLLIVPILNPDGVELGNWRHNASGIDLNRDWNKFEQQETRLINHYLETLLNDKNKLVMGLDFHSTKEDVFYTIPASAAIAPKNLVTDWLEDVQDKSKNFFKVRNKPGNAPGRGVFKQYIADTFQVHGVTYEMGDSTNRQLIKHMALVTSDSLMQTLINTPPDSFYMQENQ